MRVRGMNWVFLLSRERNELGLVLAESGALVERGQPVEGRGKDIGALMVGRLLNAISNLCYGEGEAGTWSDGKLTTRIGENGSSVEADNHLSPASTGFGLASTEAMFIAKIRLLVDHEQDKLILVVSRLKRNLFVDTLPQWQSVVFNEFVCFQAADCTTSRPIVFHLESVALHSRRRWKHY
ncbi:hypothetical protein KC19_VG233100 [Ceratodon purpureus]|uniref:Uncharacterized protein n=1 Tax=Ceratodon purpureus TaxID=3225 RepID=A0A8T0HST5_CERPU|nr:hypothetical protein KC19_VG233100 [Ceratodon purpureus]